MLKICIHGGEIVRKSLKICMKFTEHYLPVLVMDAVVQDMVTKFIHFRVYSGLIGHSRFAQSSLPSMPLRFIF
jgi:hypothetical protein